MSEEIKSCPFCKASGATDGEHYVVAHALDCFFTHHYEQEMWMWGRRKIDRWNTRAETAELADLRADKGRLEAIEQALKLDPSGSVLFEINGFEISVFPDGFHVAVDGSAEPIAEGCTFRQALDAAMRKEQP